MIRVIHGTSALRAESIRRQGLVPGAGGVSFVSGSEWVAVHYAILRTAHAMVHEDGPNRGLLVFATVAPTRVTRIPREPPPGTPDCVGYQDGFWVEDGVHPEEIAKTQHIVFEKLKTDDGLWDVYRRHVMTVRGQIEDWKSVYFFSELREPLLSTAMTQVARPQRRGA